jgi:GDP-4-dehydro-6-deoxy-D-mannose reductase
MTRRALITGGAGFVGGALDAWLRTQDWGTVCCDRTGGNGVLPCDITDAAQIDAMLDAAGPVSHVFHLAALTFVPDAIRDPAQAFNVNLLGTVRLAEALQRRDWRGVFLFVSTSEVYGRPQTLPVTEAHPLEPMNPYAIAKAAADQYCGYLAKLAPFSVVRLRPFNHSGPGQAAPFVLSNFARQIALIEAGRIAPELHVGNLEACRDFLHVADVVRAYEFAALHGRSGEAYNICSGHAWKIADALRLLLELGSVEIDVRPDPARMRPIDVPSIVGDHGKISEHTGWQPGVPFTDLLQDLLEYWRFLVAREGPMK